MTLVEQSLNDSPKIGNTGQPNAKKTSINSVVSNIIGLTLIICPLFRANRPNNLTVFVFRR